MLVLSIFPGIDLLGRAFREEGFCVVQGGDVIFGGDVREERYPAGRFDGVIGGPPCQCFSKLTRLAPSLGITIKYGNLIPEFERVVSEAQPEWFLMENVLNAPLPVVAGYTVRGYSVCDWKCGGKTLRRRRFSFGSRKGWTLAIDQNSWPAQPPQRAVTGNCRIPRPEHVEKARGKGGVFPGQGTLVPLEVMCERQGLPRDFRLPAFTKTAFREAIGNGVPLAMGRAIAKAVHNVCASEET